MSRTSCRGQKISSSNVDMTLPLQNVALSELLK
jgi:hypothetical protein